MLEEYLSLLLHLDVLLKQGCDSGCRTDEYEPATLLGFSAGRVVVLSHHFAGIPVFGLKGVLIFDIATRRAEALAHQRGQGAIFDLAQGVFSYSIKY